MTTTENYTRTWSNEEMAKAIHLIRHGYSNDQIATSFAFLFPLRTPSGVSGKISDIRRISRPETTGTCRVQMSKITAKKLKAQIVAILKQPMPLDLDIAQFAEFTPKFTPVSVEDVLSGLVAVKKPVNGNTPVESNIEVAVQAEVLPTLNRSRQTAETMLGLILNNLSETIEISINSPSIKLNLTVQPD